MTSDATSALRETLRKAGVDVEGRTDDDLQRILARLVAQARPGGDSPASDSP